jgi:hypothetical protein
MCHNTTPLSGAKMPRLCLVITVVPVQVKVDIVVTPSQANFVFHLAVTDMPFYKPVSPIAFTSIAMFVKGALQVVMLGVNYPAASARVRIPFLMVKQGYPFE